MRPIYGFFLLSTLAIAGGYWYTNTTVPCHTPLPYRIGTIDSRFSLTEGEVRDAITKAEHAWEEVSGRELFTYDPAASLSVNLIYDERQAFANTEEEARTILDQNEATNEDFIGNHAALVERYAELERAYKEDAATFQDDLDTYNTEVESYNRDGGAPPQEFERLNRTKSSLDEQHRALENASARLAALADEINRLGEEGNERIQAYNENVERYNETFGTAREFTEGDYQGDSINIYTFSDQDELVLVLAHELGHALGLDHVENERSIMYWMLGGQEGLRPTDEDLAALTTVCSERNLSTRIRALFP